MGDVTKVLEDINKCCEKSLGQFLFKPESDSFYIMLEYNPNFDASIFGDKIDDKTKRLLEVNLSTASSTAQYKQTIVRLHALEIHENYVNKRIEDYKLFVDIVSDEVFVTAEIKPIMPVEFININLAVSKEGVKFK